MTCFQWDDIEAIFSTVCPLRLIVAALFFLYSSVFVGLSPPEHSPVGEAEIPDTRVVQSEALLPLTERPL